MWFNNPGKHQRRNKQKKKKKKKKKIVRSSFDQMFFCTISKNIFRISEKSWYSTQYSIFLVISTAKAAIAIPFPNKPSLETDFSSTLKFLVSTKICLSKYDLSVDTRN